jgi:ATP-dependent DNA ligase
VTRLPGLPLESPLAPMEAKLAEALPPGDDWQFEPKWDGFRCLVLRSGDAVELQSKSGKPLGRYFPEMVDAVRAMAAERFVLDGELVIAIGDALSFDALQMRLHPAASRIARLALETPAQMMLFDCLADEAGADIRPRPLRERRRALERIHAQGAPPALLLSPATADRGIAQDWLDSAGAALDGVVAKRLDGPYVSGERAMIKVKQRKSADCVVGGFRYGSGSREVASLLLGLYDEEGKLDHVGFTSSIPAADRPELTRRLEALIEPPGFTGDAPGGPSRWSTDRSGDWQPLRPELVAEVRYDHVTGRRFRQGTKFLRWRPDKAPEQCRFDQLEPAAAPAELVAELAT